MGFRRGVEVVPKEVVGARPVERFVAQGWIVDGIDAGIHQTVAGRVGPDVIEDMEEIRDVDRNVRQRRSGLVDQGGEADACQAK